MSQQRDFINGIKESAVNACKGDKIFPSIVIAQACLESAFGKSGLSLNCNNFFGIKAGSKWQGETKVYKTKEFKNGQPYMVDAVFAKYDDFEHCLEEHNAMLHRVPNYANAGLFKCSSPEGQANALRKAGYATDPGYPQKLMRLIDEYNLKQYDTFLDGSSVAFFKPESV